MSTKSSRIKMFFLWILLLLLLSGFSSQQSLINHPLFDQNQVQPDGFSSQVPDIPQVDPPTNFITVDLGIFAIRLEDMTPGSEAILKLYDYEGGTLLAQVSKTAEDDGTAYFEIQDHKVYFKVGAYMEITDVLKDQTFTYTVQPLYLDKVDYESQTLVGRAKAGDIYTVFVWTTAGDKEFVVAAHSDGFWALDLAPLGYTLKEGPSYLPHIREFTASGGDGYTFFTYAYHPYCEEGTSITGQVFEADGTILRRSLISFYNATTSEIDYITYTNLDGTYGCNLPDGDYKVNALHMSPTADIRYSSYYYPNASFLEDAQTISVSSGVGASNIDFVLDTPREVFELFTFHMTDPIVSELAVRQAIAYGTNRQQLVDRFYPGNSYVMSSYLTKYNWAYTKNGVPQYAYNPQLARQTLAAAGWIDTNGDGVREKGGQLLEIDYYYSATARLKENREIQAELFVADMAAIGIKVNAIASTHLYDVATFEEFGILNFSWVTDYTGIPDGMSIYYSDNLDANLGKYDSAEADALVDAMNAEPSLAGKLPYFYQHQALIMEDLAILPLYQRCDFGDSDCDMVVDLLDVCPRDINNNCNQSNSTAEIVDVEGGNVVTNVGDVEVNVPSGAVGEAVPISISDSGTQFSVMTDQGTSTAVMGAALGPEGQTFEEPVSVILHWDDANNDGIVDGTNLSETELYISKDGKIISDLCMNSSGCDQNANTFTVQVTSFSEFAVVSLKDLDENTLGAFNGSTEINSDQPIVAISRPHNGKEIMAYNGVNAGATTLYLPMLFNDKWNYTSTFTVENTTASVSTYDITFKDAEDGSTTCILEDESLPGHRAKTYDVTKISSCDVGSLPTDWFGGATIEASQPMIAVAKPIIEGSDPITYNAFTAGAETAYLPMLFRGIWGYQSAFYVQNLGSADANLTIDFYDATGNYTCTLVDPNPVGSNVTRGYWMSSIKNVAGQCEKGATGAGFAASGWAGSAVITSTGSSEIVAIGRPHMGNEVAAYNGFSSGSTNNYLPMLFRDIWGYNAAMYIQNISTANTSITIDFYDAQGNYTCTYDDPTPLEPNATRGYWVPSVKCTSGGNFPASGGWAGSAEIITDQEVIAVGRPHLTDGEVVAYTAFTGGGARVFLPIMFRQYNGNETALYIQNLGTVDANTTITFYDEESGFYCSMEKTIAPGSAGAIWLAGVDQTVCVP